MADIVQLEEKGNLLYPKTHTSAIDNFDETVVKKTGNETISGVKNFKDGIQINGENLINDKIYSLASIPLGFGVIGGLNRVGNLVTLSVHANQNNTRSNGQSNLAEKIPLGYRPTQMQCIPAMISIGKTIETGRFLTQIIRPDGSMQTYNKGMDVAPLSISFSTTWITNDPIPV
ncbi:hypothetical protein [Enterococcus caccae]|uniref:Uncharacterized protein n=1 Tax=Enterococcus caccae ATCC BAA-1240 TaxID=1158612 RepID=R3U1M9_9ENTE|nr:hypothetical protein [Enterococcus caccae]EOL47814.1 hypothetical protein UC7_01064 [Enterococcus caccae ATCC BAA-1240]EOT65612.1 hypothetical protein I580_01368 [Enterococcus caccae ATCC BAA-1240]OJG27204.1 hypothetical protein RU98_GL002656 [Enterococcus caccae]